MGVPQRPNPPVGLPEPPAGDVPPREQVPQQTGQPPSTSAGASARARSTASGALSDQVFIESEMLAYRGLSALAHQIARAAARIVKDREAILLLTDGDEDALVAFRSFRSQVEALEDAYRDIAVEPPEPPDTRLRGKAIEKKESAAPPSIPGILTPWAELMAKAVDLFTVTVSVSAREFSADDDAFVAQVGGRLTGSGCTVLLPRPMFLSPDVAPDGTAPAPSLAGLLGRLARARAAAAARVGALGPPDQDGEKRRLDALRELHAQFERALVTPDSRTGVALLPTAQRGATVARGLSAAGYVLSIKVARLGGSTREKKFLFWTWITQSGGAIARFFLYRADGQLLLSDTCWQYEGFRNFASREPPNLAPVADPLGGGPPER